MCAQQIICSTDAWIKLLDTYSLFPAIFPIWSTFTDLITLSFMWFLDLLQDSHWASLVAQGLQGTRVWCLVWEDSRKLRFPGGSVDKESACNAGDPGSIPGSGRSSGEGKGKPLQCSCLENPMDRGTWQPMVHGVPKSWTWLSDFTFTFWMSTK